MTRVEGGALRLRKQWQPLEEVVGTALRRTETMLEGRDVSVALPDAMVPIDASLVEQVLVNLLENASKYTPPATPIRIGAILVEGALRVEVEDRGAGIPEEEADRVFEKFHRVRTDLAGAGLGLAICAGIVKAHGGRIWVEPRGEGGASFRFTLPIDGEPPPLENGELPA
ncbi:MAG: sensor histidine kinase, partial [Polyangiales bacterium]